MSLIVDMVESLLEMPGIFAEVATTNPVAGVMLFVGSVLFALSLGYFAILTAGAVLSLVSPGDGGQEFPRAR